MALPLFAAGGFAGTSVRAVAQAAGVNVATLAYHFDSKEGLYDTLVQRLHVELAAFPTDAPSGGVGEALRWWMQTAWSFASSHREHLRLLVRHVLDHGEQPAVVIDNWSAELLARADALLTAFRPEWDPARRRLLILSVMHLTVRLVLEDRGQLAFMIGIPEAQVEGAVVDWLTSLAARELGLTGPGD